MIANQDPSNQLRWLNSIDRNLSKMLELCSQLDVPVILVSRAEKLEGRLGFVSTRADQINSIQIKHNGSKVTYFSTNDQFFKVYPHTRGKKLLFEDETHWTDYAHRLIAKQLVNYIILD
jgi:hypothetical protein